MPLLEDPARLSKSRLKSDLLAHNVALPPANSRKEVYVGLHLKHIEPKNAIEFSSDEEDQVQEEAKDKVEGEDDPDGADPSMLTDDDLRSALIRHGVKVGPIVASTRAVYEKKLRRLLQPCGRDEQVNGKEENAVLYSDSEDETEGSEADKEQTVEQPEQSHQEKSQMENRRSVSDTELNGSDVQECQSQSSRLHLLTVDQQTVKNQTLFYTPDSYPVKRGTKPPVEPVNGVLKDISPTQASPTGIYATRRRPIKGAAGRPVQYVFPDTPTSPTTLERREVERRLVPIHIQILVFLIVAFLLFLIYVFVEDSSLDSVMSLLDSPNQESDMETFYGHEAVAISEQK